MKTDTACDGEWRTYAGDRDDTALYFKNERGKSMKKRLFEQFDKEFLELCKGTCLERLHCFNRFSYLLDFLLFSGVIDCDIYRFLSYASRVVCLGE